jgi:acetyl-CoA synthetase
MRDGSRREWSFGQITDLSARLAGTFRGHGVARGDVVLTLIGNRIEWVLTMLACFRIGAIVLPCTEQLRTGDLRQRMNVAEPALIVADQRNADELHAAGPRCRVLFIPDDDLFASDPAPPEALGLEDPCLITFTSGTSGEPKAVLHAQRYVTGQRLQATHWLGPRTRELVWCTASSGWSKSARNVFIAPWLRGATALLHDGRFDPHERLEILARERVNVLCMAPTEYRIIANRAELHRLRDLRCMVAAGEPLGPEVLDVWSRATGIQIRDGYGQTETGQLTGMPIGEAARPGSMGLPLPGIVLDIVEGELVADARTVATFFLGYLGEERVDRTAPWRTGDRVIRDEDGYLQFVGRIDDVIISAGYRIGPFEVESALLSHPAVADTAVVAAPDRERGAVVRAVVVLQDGHTPSRRLVQELQDHVKAQTAPYKYPRIVDFVAQLPKTSSGKVKRAELRR